MHDIYPFVLPYRVGEQLWREFRAANAGMLNEKYGARVYTGRTPGGYEQSFSWYEVDVTVKSPIHVEFNVYGMRNEVWGGRGDLKAEISHSYPDNTLYPHIAEEQRRVAARVLAERERLAAALELERKLAATYLELFGEPICEPTDSNI